jgi:hypothetical protein
MSSSSHSFGIALNSAIGVGVVGGVTVVMGVVGVAGVVGGTVTTVVVIVVAVVIVVVTGAGTIELPIKYPTTPAMIINTARTAIKVVGVFLELTAYTQIIVNRRGYLYSFPFQWLP